MPTPSKKTKTSFYIKSYLDFKRYKKYYKAYIKKKSSITGFKIYDKPLLISYPRSGTNWINYIISFLTEKPTPGYGTKKNQERYIIDRAHKGFSVIENYESVILSIRNYKECLIRNLQEEWFVFQDVNKFLINKTNIQPAYWYIKNIEAFHNFKKKKFLIYYEDLMISPKETISKLADFLNLSDSDRLNELIDNIDFHKTLSVEKYQVNKSHKSFTQGDVTKLEFHSQSLLSKKDRIIFDDYYQNNYPELFELYLKRYIENARSND